MTDPETIEPKTYSGQCHCGTVRYTVRTVLAGLSDCNCSRCRRLGWVMQFAPASDFNLLSGQDNLTLYQFNTEKIEHLFCKTCGIESFARGQGQNGEETVVINVNCLEGAPAINRANVKHWDGANF